MRNIILAISFLFLGVAAFAASHNYTISVTTTLSMPTGDNIHYMAATGCNDANAGTSPASPWCTPNHALNCGDVIVAAAGNYSSTNFGSWGTVSNCPSTTGGIDGAGGIYFAVLLCGGADLEACHESGQLFDNPKNNWAVEGWKVTNPGTGSANRAFNADGCASVVHHQAYINNIAYGVSSGYHTDDCGGTGANFGLDYYAVVGNIAQNAANNSDFCEAAVDIVGPGVFDTAAGTHYYVYGNFSYANVNVPCRSVSDVESYMFDTWNATGRAITTQGVIANNFGWGSDRMCVQLFSMTNGTNNPTIKIHNNTCFNNNTHTGGENMDGEINLNLGSASGTYIIQNNIANQTLSVSSGGGGVAAFALYSSVTNLTHGGAGAQNVYMANNSQPVPPASCASGFSFCDSTNSSESNGSSGNVGTNTYTSPSFANTTDLLANWVGAPTCTGFENVSQCMGYDAGTGTLTNNTPIADLTAGCAGCSGKGYQRTSNVCSANAEYPTWLKGIVYLHWDNANTRVIQRAGLVSVPCGM